MVDVVRDDGAATGDFAAHELRRDLGRDAGAEVLALVLAAEQLDHLFAHRAGGAQVLQVLLAVHVFPDGHVFHFRGDDALAGVVHLGNVHAGLGAARLAVQAGEAQFVEGRIGGALAAEFAGQIGQHLGVAALLDPALAQRRQAGADVDAGGRVGVGAGTVVDVDRRVLFATEGGRRVVLRDFAHRYAQVRARTRDVDLARIGQRRDGGFVDVSVGSDEFFGGVHGVSLRREGASVAKTAGREERCWRARPRRCRAAVLRLCDFGLRSASLRRHDPYRFKGTLSAAADRWRHP